MLHVLRNAAPLITILVLFIAIGSTDGVAAPLQDDPTQAGGKGGQAPEAQDRRERGEPVSRNGPQEVDDDNGKASASGRNRGASDVPRERAPSPQDVGDPSDPETQATRRILLEEAKYRNRVAKLNRLRELAQAQGNEERLRAIDALEQRMTEQHNRKIERTREQLGKRFDKVNERLEKGRDKKPDHAGRPDQPGRDRGKPDDATKPGKPANQNRGNSTGTTPDGTGKPGKGADEPGAPRGQGQNPSQGRGEPKQNEPKGGAKPAGKSGGKGGKP